MAQGKLKVKAKLPQNAKPRKSKAKGNAVTQRSNRPIKPKKRKQEEAQKLKQNISKALNKAVEEDIRSISSNGQKNLSRAQQAVAQYHRKTESS